MSDQRLTNEQVSNLSRRDSPVDANLARSLAREVQASRKLIADLRIEAELFPQSSMVTTIRMIDEAGL